LIGVAVPECWPPPDAARLLVEAATLLAPAMPRVTSAAAATTA
jgi:hypothetical protein